MDTNVILQIVIALVALFWLLSTACSYIVEGFNSIVRNLRAEALERFICEMIIGQDKVRGAYALFRGSMAKSPAADPLGLLSHGLITSLRKPQSDAGGEGTAPTYIPANIFSKALLDRLASLALTLTFDATKTNGVIAGFAADESPPGTSTPTADAWKGVLARVQDSDPKASGLYAFGSVVFDGTPQETLDQAIARLSLLLQTWAVPGVAAAAPAIARLSTPEARAIARQMQALLLSGIASIEELKKLPTKGRWAKLLDVVLGKKKKGEGAGQPGDRFVHSLIEPGALWMLAARNVEGAPVVGQNLLDAFAAVVEQAPLPRSLREALRPIFANANFDLATLRSGIESWYDDVMQRASGWFKRHTTWSLAVVGLFAAVTLNVNPFLVVGDLARDPELRSAGVAFAQEAATQGGGPIVGQQIIFSKAADSLKWKERVDKLVGQRSDSPHSAPNSLSALAPWAAGASAAPATASASASATAAGPAAAAASAAPVDDGVRQRVLRQIALEMQPLLLRSGSFVGLISASRESLDRSDVASAYASDKDRLAYRASVCRARLEDTSRPSSEANANKIALNVASDTERWSDDRICPELHALFGESKTPTQDHDVFWKSPDVVWVPSLSVALRDAEAVVAGSLRGGAADRVGARIRVDNAIELLRMEIARTQEFAGRTKRIADDFLDRIPSLGWSLDRINALTESNTRTPTTWEKMAKAWNEFWSQCLEHWGFIGWPVTALMVSFGAPFWFDLMSKLVNRRVTGPKPTNGET